MTKVTDPAMILQINALTALRNVVSVKAGGSSGAAAKYSAFWFCNDVRDDSYLVNSSFAAANFLDKASSFLSSCFKNCACGSSAPDKKVLTLTDDSSSCVGAGRDADDGTPRTLWCWPPQRGAKAKDVDRREKKTRADFIIMVVSCVGVLIG